MALRPLKLSGSTSADIAALNRWIAEISNEVNIVRNIAHVAAHKVTQVATQLVAIATTLGTATNTAVFVPTNNSISWTAFQITTANLQIINIAAGSIAGLTDSTLYFLFYNGSNGAIQQTTNTATLDLSQDIILGKAVTACNTPAAPTLSSVALSGGVAATFYVKVQYIFSSSTLLVFGVGSPESSIAIASGNTVKVTSPVTSGKATNYNVYLSTSSGTETLVTGAPIALGTDFTYGGAATTSLSPTAGGGGGGGGFCFTPETLVRTFRGDVPIAELTTEDWVLTAAKNWRKIAKKFEHDYTGPLFGKCCTSNHHLLAGDLLWKRSQDFLPQTATDFSGKVYSLEVDTDEPIVVAWETTTEHSFYLPELSLFAHNVQPMK